MLTQPQFSINKNKELLFFGHNLAKVKARTPSYIYSKSAIVDRVQEFRKELFSALQMNSRTGKSGRSCFIHYAMKANSNLTLLKLMQSQKLQIDVVSGGELKLALRAGFKPQDVLFSGVGKTVEEIKMSIGRGVFQLNVESLSELVRIGRIANTLKKNIGIGLRVNPGVNPKTHPYIATGFRENKFGIDATQIFEAVEILRQFPRLRYQGLSLHIGSQLFHFKDLQMAIRKTLEIEKELEFLGFHSEGLDIGGGLGVDYRKNSEQVDSKNLHIFTQAISKSLKNYPKNIRLEPGRFLVARAGILLTEVQYVKKTPHKNFLIVDTGMNHLLRPSLYQAEHRIFSVIQNGTAKNDFDVVGPICESSDVIGKNRKFSEVKEGDRLAIADAGAYGYSMASRYNSIELPPELFI